MCNLFPADDQETITDRLTLTRASNKSVMFTPDTTAVCEIINSAAVECTAALDDFIDSHCV